MIDSSFLKQLDKFSLIINKKVTSNYAGQRESRAIGSGLIFKDHTNYSLGDDFRNINWNIYARLNKLFIKRYEEERNLTVHVIVDFSGSMDYGKKIRKSEYASMVGLGYAYIAMKNNEKFVLSTFSDKLEVFRPKKGVKQLATIIDYLERKKAGGVSSFYTSLIKYKNLINSKSLIVVISDFLYDIKEIRDVLVRLGHNEIKLIQVLDPVEKKMNLEGDYDLVDAESSNILRTFINPFLRKKYQNKLGEHNDKIIQVCNNLRANFYSVTTDQPIFDVFYYSLLN